MMLLEFDTNSMQSYEQFLRLKSIPSYWWEGRSAVIPDDYAHLVDSTSERLEGVSYQPSNHCFDYQRDIARLAIQKRKYAVFADCGFGKTIIQFEVLRHALRETPEGKFLLVAPLMVVRQTMQELQKFYGYEIAIQQLNSNNLQEWLSSPNGARVGITHYETFRDDYQRGELVGLFLDESSMLKSHYGKWGARLIKLGKGLTWKMAFTGTPAPNDRIEYANHAVFLDHFRTTNEFLATYFINRGQTQNRWEIKPHALGPFYRDISHWCIFLSDPSVYGWKDNTDSIPPIHTHIEDVPLTDEQRKAVQELTGKLTVTSAGGIGQRSKLLQIAKGAWKGKVIPTHKPSFVRQLVDSWPEESTIIWCHFNDEQDQLESIFPDAVSISGSTPLANRDKFIDQFKSGEVRVLISKPKILGFGLNLQVATRQIFNGMNDSYEDFYQAVKRSNRIGSHRPLNVHIPITEIEEPMVSNVLQKASRVESDTREQEGIFKSYALI